MFIKLGNAGFETWVDAKKVTHFETAYDDDDYDPIPGRTFVWLAGATSPITVNASCEDVALALQQE